MKNGFRVLDSDIHVLEPIDMWREYLDPEFRDRAPQPTPSGEAGWLVVDGRALPAGADTPERKRALEIRYLSERMLEKIKVREAAAGEASGLDAGTTPTSMLAAMDIEGIDVAVVFRTFAAHVIAFDDIDPPYAAALCRAFNRWAADFCSEDPPRLKVGSASRSARPICSGGSASFRPTSTRRASCESSRRSARTTSSSRPTGRTTTRPSPTPSTSSCRSTASPTTPGARSSGTTPPASTASTEPSQARVRRGGRRGSR
ncbi:MAG TPA: hypothetical protein VM618_12345 [Acidimicrobiia bacterium]|nr:hypothetical protein [Acidimicrobiia bacterium]